MHGRRKADRKQSTEEERKIRAAKIAKYNAAKAAVLSLRARGARDGASLAATAAVAEVNPDFYSVWNFRRDIITHIIQQE